MSRFSRCVKLPIACIGGASVIGSACAQSSVTLYGRVDAGLLYMSRTLNAKTGLNDGHQLAAVDGGNSPTVFGLTGVEDLGGGAKVRFTLESGVWRDQQFQRQFLRASGLYFSGRQAG